MANLTKAQVHKLQQVSDALDWVKTYYPEFWGRMQERDIIHLLTIAHSLFKSEPQLLEATTKQRRDTPTQ